MTEIDRTAWLAERNRIPGVGGSEAAAAIGLLGSAARLELWARKRGLLPPWEGNEAARWGLIHEENIAAEYAERTGYTVVRPIPMISRHPERPWQFASLDRKATGPHRGEENGGHWRNVQIKVASTREGWGEAGTDRIPERYYAQVQHEMEVSGLRITDLPVLFQGTKLEIFTVEYHEEFCRLMTAKEAEFVGHLTAGTEPPIDYTDPDIARLMRIIHEPDASRACVLGTQRDIELAEQWAGWDRECAARNSTAKDAKEARDAIEAQLIARMGAAAVGHLANGWRIERKATHVVEKKVREYDRHYFEVKTS